MAIREKSKEKRNALLDATLSLVNNNGFHAAPMSKIAKMAKVSPATIYIYFDNKQDLINQLYLEKKKAYTKHAFEGYSESMPVKKAFELIWYNIADYKLKELEESWFLSQCDNTMMIDEEVRQEGLMHLQPLLNLWERGQKEGIVKDVSHYVLYAYAINSLSFLMNMQKRELFQIDNKSLDQVFQSAWDSIRI
ncbi:TetR/AcrR family transcriptional regulator [Marinifilum sp. RC60d5]|uniref:TetR/AcrR family transcriptional regulator n=1 Tax=Marinifilum sp. RC60d5 TaxID=3458414 RepID=UPI00403741A7